MNEDKTISKARTHKLRLKTMNMRKLFTLEASNKDNQLSASAYHMVEENWCITDNHLVSTCF